MPAMTNVLSLIRIKQCLPSLFFDIYRLSPGIEELVKKLEANNTTVYLISGGFRQMINVCCQ
jgi:phosphoserine phosphatase